MSATQIIPLVKVKVTPHTNVLNVIWAPPNHLSQHCHFLNWFLATGSTILSRQCTISTFTLFPLQNDVILIFWCLRTYEFLTNFHYVDIDYHALFDSYFIVNHLSTISRIPCLRIISFISSCSKICWNVNIELSFQK